MCADANDAVPRLLKRDGDLWVFDKPSGFTVHPLPDSDAPDLMSWAHKALAAPSALAPIHRLDRGTSGLVLCSPDAALRAEIGGWLARGEVGKRYRALVYGRTRRKGVIRRPLKDARRRRSLDASTRYRLLEWLGKFSYLEVRPETGRQHQIRRHLQGLGHSVIGDTRYRPRKFRTVPAFPGRLWLHAMLISLPDGRSFEAPLPPELADHLTHLSEREMEQS